jgi:hypothetical protein
LILGTIDIHLVWQLEPTGLHPDLSEATNQRALPDADAWLHVKGSLNPELPAVQVADRIMRKVNNNTLEKVK